MRELVKHLWRESAGEILDNSILNCHAKDLHSIMLINKPGQRLRMFFAEESHDLWSNDLSHPSAETKAMTVGFHQHHCNIKIVPILGEVHNIGFEKSEPRVTSHVVYDFEYESQILTGKQKFKQVGTRRIRMKTPKVLKVGDALSLHAEEFHTINLVRDLPAAWFIFEGSEWPEYKPICISDADLENLVLPDYMYQKTSSLQSSDHVRISRMLNIAFNGM